MEGKWEKEWDNEKEDTDIMSLTTATERIFGFIGFLYLSILHTFTTHNPQWVSAISIHSQCLNGI